MQKKLASKVFCSISLWVNALTKGTAVLLMGGLGVRMNSSCQDKSLVPVAGKPVFLHSLLAINALETFSYITIVIRDEAQRSEVERHIDTLNLHSNVSYIQGGDSRQKSVLNALLHGQWNHPDFALIHDAVRPLVTEEHLRSLLSALGGHDAAILAHRATDTLMNVSNGKRSYLPRDTIWHVETPQVFKYKVILDAYLRAKSPLTDDSSALPNNSRVKIIENFTPNIKITYPQDLATVEALLSGNLMK
jgi:2-C-methyl-D-erythritol 4-phosphate cytidylyltransferase